jgi:hypothetical protein
MKTQRHLIVLAALAAFAGGAFAHSGEATPDYPQPYTSTLTRAEVHAQAIAAAKAGQIVRGEASYVMAQSFESGTTRDEVRAEAIEARRLGLVADGEMPVRDATAAELEQIRMAGERARTASLRLAAAR